MLSTQTLADASLTPSRDERPQQLATSATPCVSPTLITPPCPAASQRRPFIHLINVGSSASPSRAHAEPRAELSY